MQNEYAPETWAFVPSKKNRVMASSLGRILRLEDGRSGKPSNEIVQPHFAKHQSKYYIAIDYVHQLVCEAFHGPRPGPEYVVDHINGDTLDNRACNLRWVTKRFNNSTERAKRLKSKHARKTSRSNQLVRLEKDGEVVFKKNLNRAAEFLGCTRQAIIASFKSKCPVKGWKASWVTKDEAIAWYDERIFS